MIFIIVLDGECTTISISYSGNDDDLNEDSKLFLGEYNYVGKSEGNGATMYRHEYKGKMSGGSIHEDAAYLVKIGIGTNWNKDDYWKVVVIQPFALSIT